jgi:hypothetical protein
MIYVEEKLKYVVLRNTHEGDINFAAELEQRPNNALFVGQWRNMNR